jgi:hypothetical protein
LDSDYRYFDLEHSLSRRSYYKLGYQYNYLDLKSWLLALAVREWKRLARLDTVNFVNLDYIQRSHGRRSYYERSHHGYLDFESRLLAMALGERQCLARLDSFVDLNHIKHSFGGRCYDKLLCKHSQHDNSLDARLLAMAVRKWKCVVGLDYDNFRKLD